MCRNVPTSRVVGLSALLLVLGAQARPASDPASPFANPMQTSLTPADPQAGGNDERIIVLGRRRHLRTAPIPGYGNDRAPWEADAAIRDTMTGADTAPFGNAYNLGSLLGSDERSNETGGPFVAPRHP